MTPTETAAMARRIRAEKARRNMHRFAVDVAWPVVEAGTKFKDNWHLHAIFEHLQAVLDNKIKNLVINMPPRFMKSLSIAVTFPTFAWLDRPEMRFIYASYAKNLSVRDAVKSRRVIESPFYQDNYGDLYQMTTDQNVKERYENDRTGHRIATSVGGMGTGEGGDVIVVDDPHNILEAESDATRQETLNWWSETMSTRLNDPDTGHKIIVMQRVHEQDLSGDVLDKGGYEHLMIPMRFEEKRAFSTSIGFKDPRTEDGELAWPSRFSEKAVQELENALGPYAVAGQFQQTPTPRGGALFAPEKIHIVDVLPADLVYVRGWDFAATEEKTGTNPAWTVGAKVGKRGSGVGSSFYIAHVTRGRFGPLDVEKALKQTAELDGKGVRISMPQDPGQAGKVQKAAYVSLLAGYTVVATPESGSKVQRAEPVASQVDAGNVYMLRADWNQVVIDEMRKFPAGKFKDTVDAISRAMGELFEAPTGVANLLEYMQRRMEQVEAENKRQNADNTPGTRVIQLLGAVR